MTSGSQEWGCDVTDEPVTRSGRSDHMTRREVVLSVTATLLVSIGAGLIISQEPGDDAKARSFIRSALERVALNEGQQFEIENSIIRTYQPNLPDLLYLIAYK